MISRTFTNHNFRQGDNLSSQIFIAANQSRSSTKMIAN
jgi:hypothetical protein